MEEERVITALPKPLTVVVAVAAMAAIVGVAYRLDRAYGRWLIRMDPLTKSRERFEHARDRYRTGRADVSDFAHLINDLMDEIDRARSPRMGR